MESAAKSADSTDLIPSRPRFDYSPLKSSDRQFLRSTEAAIHSLVRRSASNLVEIGERILRAKNRIPYGLWEDWCVAELPWSFAQSRRLVQVAEAFSGQDVARFQPSALYLLSWPGVPPQAREYAIERVADGEEITHANAKAILEMYRPAAVPPGITPAAKPSLRDEPKRDDRNPERRDAESWRKFERLMTKMGMVHITKVSEGESDTFQITCYPDDESLPMANHVRMSLDELIAKAAGEETLKLCPKCKRDLPRDRFASDANSADGKNRACKDCERIRTAGRVRKERQKIPA